MMEWVTPQEAFDSLQQNGLFRTWKQHHGKAYLSHFFCALSANGIPKEGWEIGFFDPSDAKITVFAELENQDFQIKPADDVFRTPDMKVEELGITQVKTEISTIWPVFVIKAQELFPKETLGDGFLILQTVSGKTLWNYTFISRSLKFVNIKLSAADGEVQAHQEFSLIDTQKGQNAKE